MAFLTARVSLPTDLVTSLLADCHVTEGFSCGCSLDFSSDGDSETSFGLLSSE